MDGIFNINKPKGMTSHDVVAIIRKHLKQKRIGHAGTLDPLASGVLPICVGQATRVAEYLSDNGKAYLADIKFGIATDTYDAEGSITSTASTADLTLNMIEETLEQFRGPQMQYPPHYSAIKIQGQPAYKRARAGEAVVLEPRPIVINSLEIRDWIPPRLTLAIECSKGTYIRSLAHDLGMQLGCFAYLEALVRTRSGPFLLSDSITLEQLAGAVETNSIQHYAYPLDKALEQYPAFKLDAETVERIKHGNTFNNPVANNSGFARVYDTNGAFIAIAEWNEEQLAWQPKKVFASV
jgi:tRNA pseudouridine55 synthase